MALDAVAFQALNGLAAASGLFFVGAGLSLIFGVTRIINMAHGSLYMVGIYLAYTIATAAGGGVGYRGGIAAAARRRHPDAARHDVVHPPPAVLAPHGSPVPAVLRRAFRRP